MERRHFLSFRNCFILIAAIQLWFLGKGSDAAEYETVDFSEPEGGAFTDQEMNAARNECLKWHNIFRAWHRNMPPVTLNDTLNKHAQAYAEKLIKTGKFGHDGNELNSLKEGENLFGGMGGRRKAVNDAGSAVRAWYFEFCNTKSHPWGKLSHFTQLIWKDSVNLGVGVAANADRSRVVVVARYKPPGNFDSKSSMSKNLMPLACDDSNVCDGLKARQPIKGHGQCGRGGASLKKGSLFLVIVTMLLGRF